MSIIVNNKRIVKNTFYLYIRQALSLIISLYTSRIILHELGTDDFGLYSVVGSILGLFTFVSGTLYSATSRFLTIELGKGDTVKMKQVFSNSFTLHTILSTIVVLVGDIGGSYLINNIMDIPSDRMFACNVLFQTIVITTFFQLSLMPCGALIISYEKMNFFAWMGIFDIVGKLFAAITIQFISSDRIIYLACFNLIVSLAYLGIQTLYCIRKFPDVSVLRFQLDKILTKQVMSFSFWQLIGALAFVARTQGVGVLLNIFFGPLVNAANAIAYQINNAVSGFVSNFSLASNPQITKSYASNNYDDLNKLIFRTGKFTFFLVLILCAPILIMTPYILKIWLGEYPEYTVIMSRLVLVIALVESFTYSIGCAINATGNVRNYQLSICAIMLMIFPISFILFKLGFEPYTALEVYLGTSIVALICRMYFIKSQLNISPKDYFNIVFLKTIPIGLLGIILPNYIIHFFKIDFVSFILFTLLTESIIFCSIWFFSLNESEKSFIGSMISKFIPFKRNA